MKNVLITGATRGLGLAITRQLVEDKFFVIATGRKETDAILKLKAKYPDNFSFEPFDLVDTDDIYHFTDTLIKKYGHFYGLVNNAAVGLDGVLPTMHQSDIEKLITVNVTAPIMLAKYCSRSMMLTQQGGRIINISSIIASTGFSGLSVYGASKASMEGFTRSLSRELGKRKITVNAVAPGYMQTEMTSNLSGEKLDSIVRRSPFKELATVEDVSYGVSYLMSKKADKITGTILTIDAGSTA